MSNIFAQLLNERFGFSEFRPGQLETLSILQEGSSALGLMPTGSGKSLIYQLFTFYKSELTLVVTPLIALMEDQAQKAYELGLKAAFVHSQIPAEEREKRIRQLQEGEYKLFFATPERFQKPEFQSALSKRKISLFVVDEAHCISLWGHDFRPDYAKLGEVRRQLGEPLTLALTATATPDVQSEILISLNLPDAKIVASGLKRPNLQLSVEEAYGFESKMESLIPRLENRTGAALVYTTLIKSAEEIRHELKRRGLTALIYHGDLPANRRRQALKSFMKDKTAIMVATPAFGLGIDKPNIRGVYHFEPPASLESYFQEVGRAGRDGLPADAILFYDEEDLSIPMGFIASAHPERSYIEKMYRLIESNQDRARSEGREWVAEEISFKNRRDHRVDSALGILERWDCIVQTQNGGIILTGPLKDEFFTLENQQELLKHHNKKLYSFLQWIKNTEDCRMLQIYHYFGQDEKKKCGHCDVCLKG